MCRTDDDHDRRPLPPATDVRATANRSTSSAHTGARGTMVSAGASASGEQDRGGTRGGRGRTAPSRRSGSNENGGDLEPETDTQLAGARNGAGEAGCVA